MKQGKKAKQFILQRSWTDAISKTQNWTRSSKNTKDVLYYVEALCKMTPAGFPASHMTAAMVLDVISRLPGSAGQASDAVADYTQVKMEDAPNYRDYRNQSAPAIWIRLPRSRRPKSWDEIQDPMVRLKRNLYGHPSARLLWERQFEKALIENCFEKVQTGNVCSCTAKSACFSPSTMTTQTWEERLNNQKVMWAN